MNKLILIVLLLSVSISLNAMQRLKSLQQLKEYKYIFLVYEKDGCPWCVKYKNELDYIETKYKSSIKFFKVKKGTEMSSKLRKEYGYKVIIYPMTYILKLDKGNELKLLEEIYGYQTEDYIEELFKKKIFIK